MKQYFWFIIIFLSPKFLLAQTYTSFERGYGTLYDDEGTAICHSQLYYYLVAGYTKGYSAGLDKDIYLVQFNEFGGANFSAHCGSSDDESATGVVEYANGVIYVIGNATRSSDTSYSRIVLAKFDLNGTVLWWKQIGDTTKRQEANELVILPNGELAICGRTYLNSLYSGLIMICDTAGNTLHQKNFSINYNENFTDLIVTNDNEIATCTATKGSGYPELIVYGLDFNGDSLWRYSNTISANPSDVKSIIQTEDSTYCVCGNINISYTSQTFIHIFDKHRNFKHQAQTGGLYSYSNDLASLTWTSSVMTAAKLYNYVAIFGGELSDTAGVTPSEFRYLRPYTWHFDAYQTTNGANAIVANDEFNTPVCTSTGYTTLTGNGSKDLAIVHTNSGLNTKCDYNTPVISSKNGLNLCPGDSVLISRDTNAFIYQHWINLKYPYTQELGEFGDSIWVHTPGYYLLIGMNADSSIWVSNEVNIVYSDTSKATVVPSGYLDYCALDGESLSLTIQDLNVHSLQWFCNGDSIPGANLSVLNIDSSGIYYCTYVKSCGVDSTNLFQVNSSSPPLVDYNFQNFIGDYRPWCTRINQFAVESVSYYTYQWTLNGAVVSANYYCPISNWGDYAVDVSNSCGTTHDHTGTVLPRPLPYATHYSNDPLMLCGQDSVFLTPSENLTVQNWYRNSQIIPGNYPYGYYANQPGQYHFTFMTNGYCANEPIQSGPITVTIDTLPLYINLSVPTYYTCDTVFANVSPTSQILQHNLYHDGILTDTFFDSIPIFNSGNYWAEVHDAVCSIKSDTITITNSLPPLNLPLDTILCLADTLILGVPPTASYSYLWNIGDTNSYAEIYSSIQDTILLTLQVSDSGFCSTTDSTIVVFDLCAGIDEEVLSSEVIVFPTLFQNSISILNQGARSISFFIIDGMGRVVNQGLLDKAAEISTSDFAPGVYVMLLQNIKGESKAIKVVKQ